MSGNTLDDATEEPVLRELAKCKSASRKDLLFKHVITDNRDESLLKAYKVKQEIESITPKSRKYVHISSTEPLELLPEGKYTHCQGARISPHTLSRRQQKVHSALCRPMFATSVSHNILLFSRNNSNSPTKPSTRNTPQHQCT